jgi:hypothetical protein
MTAMQDDAAAVDNQYVPASRDTGNSAVDKAIAATVATKATAVVHMTSATDFSIVTYLTVTACD